MNISYDLAQIEEVVAQILEFIPENRIITFKGTLGAGKTTLIRAMCRYFGVNQKEISSPTFSIINEYKLENGSRFQKIYHMDWYRLRNEEEAFQAGVEDALQDPNALCLVEWPDKAPGLLTMPYLELIISQESGFKENRKLKLSEIH